MIQNGLCKLVFNEFDFDAFYHLNEEPDEMTNLAEDITYQE